MKIMEFILELERRLPCLSEGLCYDCKHRELPVYEEPCNSCNLQFDAQPTHWEPLKEEEP